MFDRVDLGENVVLYRGDCLAVLPTLEAGSVDAVVTDPPYGIGYASSWMTRNAQGEARIADTSFGADELATDWLSLLYPLVAYDGAVYLFTRWDVLGHWHSALESAGLHVHQRIVWDKRHWGMGDLRYFGSQVEDILFATPNGGHQLRWPKRQGNLWSIWKGEVWRDPGGHSGHPTQKPIALSAKMTELSSDPANTILDPFMGSGTTGVACVQTGRRFIGVEIDQGYFEIARARIQAAMDEMVQDSFV